MPKDPVCGFKLERAARKLGFLRIAGCDEVGRGPMFGPVVAAAVILAPKCRIVGLDDSKKVPEKRRNELDIQIREQAVAWAIAAIDVETIDRINIRNASLLAMRTAVATGTSSNDVAPPFARTSVSCRDSLREVSASREICISESNSSS